MSPKPHTTKLDNANGAMADAIIPINGDISHNKTIMNTNK